MEQKVILKESNRCIFLLKTEQISFYITIPRNSKLSLSVSLFDTIDDNKIKEIPSIPDKAIIVPIFDNNVVTGLKNNSAQHYLYLEKLLSIIVNTSYKLLKFNKIEVNTKIILDDNKDFLNFNSWYTQKYKERVELQDLGIHKNNVISQPLFNEPKSPKVNTNENINVTLTNFTPTKTPEDENIMESEEEPAASPGFISYVLLGVIVAVISLVVLYMLV